MFVCGPCIRSVPRFLSHKLLSVSLEDNILLWNSTMFWRIPVCNIKYSAISSIADALRRGETVTGTLTDSSGMSPYRRTLSSPAIFVFGTAQAAFSCGVAAVAFVKAWSIWATQGRFILQLPYVCCMLEFVGGLIRFLYYGTDPLGSRMLVGYLAQQVWRTSSIPFCLSSTLLLTFYWHETVTVRLTRGLFLTTGSLSYPSVCAEFKSKASLERIKAKDTLFRTDRSPLLG
jgi:hypothetical protein